MWANDHSDLFPMKVSTSKTNGGSMEFSLSGEVWRHFQVLSNELSHPKVLVCYRDSQRSKANSWSEIRNNSYLSYFVGLDADETKPNTFLSGDRNVTGGAVSATGVLAVKEGEPIGWTKDLHNLSGNIGLADGSAHQVSAGSLIREVQTALTTSGEPVLRLALPK